MQAILRGRALVVALSLIIVACCVGVLGTQPSLAQARTAALDVTKPTDDSFNPKTSTALIEVALLEGLEERDNDKLKQLALNNPRLLGEEPGYPITHRVQVETDDEGVAKFTNLPEGVYRVGEVRTTTGNRSTVLISPFLVSVRYGEHTKVEGKNIPDAITKAVGVEQAVPGDKLEFDLAADVPQPDRTGQLHQFVVSDPLDSRLDLTQVKDVRLSTVDGDAPLQNEEDYTVDWTAPLVTVTLSEKGLARAAQAYRVDPTAQVRLTVQTAVKRGIDTATPLRNTAYFSPDGYCLYNPNGYDAAECGDLREPEESQEVTVGLLPEPKSPTRGSVWWLIPIFVGIGWFAWPGFGLGSSDVSPHTPAPTSDPARPSAAPGDDQEVSAAKPDAAGTLAWTGANVWWLLILGAAMLMVGITLLAALRLRRKENDDV